MQAFRERDAIRLRALALLSHTCGPEREECFPEGACPREKRSTQYLPSSADDGTTCEALLADITVRTFSTACKGSTSAMCFPFTHSRKGERMTKLLSKDPAFLRTGVHLHLCMHIQHIGKRLRPAGRAFICSPSCPQAVCSVSRIGRLDPASGPSKFFSDSAAFQRHGGTVSLVSPPGGALPAATW